MTGTIAFFPDGSIYIESRDLNNESEDYPYPVISEHEAILIHYHNNVKPLESKIVEFDIYWVSFTMDGVAMSMAMAEIKSIELFL